MNFISKMPAGLRYMIEVENGKRITSLDLTHTGVNMVPRKLSGVDKVIANAGQLDYVAPDYRGQVIVMHQVISSSIIGQIKEPMPKNEVNDLKMAYQRALSYSPLVFDVSSKDMYGREQHLPAELSFNRDYSILDASKTVLVEPVHISGVNANVMPGRLLQHNLDELRCQQNKLSKIAKRKDYGYVRAVCHFQTRKSISYPDRLVK